MVSEILCMHICIFDTYLWVLIHGWVKRIYYKHIPKVFKTKGDVVRVSITLYSKNLRTCNSLGNIREVCTLMYISDNTEISIGRACFANEMFK